MRVRKNVPELRATMKEVLSQVVAAGGKKKKTIVIGTSVDGLATIELGRSGERVNSIIALWGVIENTQPETASVIKSNVVLLQGDIDPLTSKTAIDAIEEEFSKNQTSYEVFLHKDTAHAFTLPFVGTNVSIGFAYNKPSAIDSSDRISSIFVKATKQ